MQSNERRMFRNFDELGSPFSDCPIEGDCFGAAWDALLEQVFGLGKPALSRGKRTKELLGVQFTVTDMAENILVNEHRKLNYRFMVAEWLWILAGNNEVEPLAQHVPRIREFSDDGKTLAGAYGPRLITQWDYITDTLNRDKGSRQAVSVIWTPNPPPSADIPCTLTMQWFLRDGRLHTIVNMRSSDVWLGLPYDFFTFSMLSLDLASDLGATSGILQMNLGSSHLYETDFKAAETLIGSGDRSETLRVPPFTNVTVPQFARVLAPEVKPLETLKVICRA